MNLIALKTAIQVYLETAIGGSNWRAENKDRRYFVNIYKSETESDAILGKAPREKLTIELSMEVRGIVLDTVDNELLILTDAVKNAMFNIRKSTLSVVLENRIKSISFITWQKSIVTEAISDIETIYNGSATLIYEFPNYEF
jgi:hypothetical protein